MTPEIEKPAEGFWQPCPRCKGTGKETITEGILNITKREVECDLCHGAKQIFFVLQCSHMSLGQVYLEGTNIVRGSHYANCMGIHCHLWDHDHKGGCLERKIMLKELYAGL